MQQLLVKIEKMAFGGSGVGRVEGKVCFVPFTAPGDTVRVGVKRGKASYCEGEVLEIIEPSPLRVAPPCPVFGSCGGCDWQHLSYSDQLQAKQEIFAETLWRFGRVERGLILPIIPSAEPYNYRCRVQLKLHYVNGAFQVGFYQAGTHQVITIPRQCAIAHPAINALYLPLTRLAAGFPEPDKLPQMDVSVGDNGETFLIVHYSGARPEDISTYLAGTVGELPGVVGVFLQGGRKTPLRRIVGSECLSYQLPEGFANRIPATTLTFSAGGFSQVNYRQNLALIRLVAEFADLTGQERLLDLFCGNGNFSIPLAKNCAEVVGIEESGQSIGDARVNCRINAVKNANFKSMDAVAGVRGLVAGGERFDLVILDPPRAGATEVVKVIPLLLPRKIIYVSCDPATLARDIGQLRQNHYAVVKSCPVDMFPQTYHIESVTLLEKATTSDN